MTDHEKTIRTALESARDTCQLVSAAEQIAAIDAALASLTALQEERERMRQPKTLIYLATPYSHPDPSVMQGRFERACEVAGGLMASGQMVFSPIAHTHPIAVRCELPRGWDFWRNYDFAMLSAAGKVVVVQMDGWRESKGIAGEIEIAAELGIPVEYLAYDAAMEPAPQLNRDEKWLREKAAAEDGCFVSVGGLVTDLESLAAQPSDIDADTGTADDQIPRPELEKSIAPCPCEGLRARLAYIEDSYERAESDVNRQSRARFDAEAGRDSLRAELAAAKHDADRWRKAHDGILAEAARTVEASAGELALLERRATRAEEYGRNADQEKEKLTTELTASQERERELREALNELMDFVRGAIAMGAVETPRSFIVELERVASALATPEGTPE